MLENEGIVSTGSYGRYVKATEKEGWVNFFALFDRFDKR